MADRYPRRAPRANSPRRLYEDIASRLAERITGGELSVGTKLPSERELAEAYGASRTSVREALLSLQSSGLVSIRQKARARVAKPDNSVFLNQLSGAARHLLAQPNGVADFQEARALFECGLARYAARHASPKELDRMAAALMENRKAIGNPAKFAQTDLAFHSAIAEIPRNPIFIALNNALADWLLEQRSVAIRTPVRGAARRAYEGHEEVYEAIANRDVEGADAAMAAHLKIVSGYYWKSVGSNLI